MLNYELDIAYLQLCLSTKLILKGEDATNSTINFVPDCCRGSASLLAIVGDVVGGVNVIRPAGGAGTLDIELGRC